MVFKKIIILALSILLFTQMAFGEVPLPKGWYADGSAGLTNTADSDSDGDKTAMGYNVNAGYKFLPFFGVEAGYSSYGTSSSSFTGNHVVDIAVKGIIPFPEIGAEIFAKLGGMEANPQGADNATGLYYGFGADYWMSSHMTVLIQWSQAKAGDETGDLNLIAIGVGFLF